MECKWTSGGGARNCFYSCFSSNETCFVTKAGIKCWIISRFSSSDGEADEDEESLWKLSADEWTESKWSLKFFILKCTKLNMITPRLCIRTAQTDQFLQIRSPSYLWYSPRRSLPKIIGFSCRIEQPALSQNHTQITQILQLSLAP